MTISIFKASEATGDPVAGAVNTWTLKPLGNPATCLPLDWNISGTMAEHHTPSNRRPHNQTGHLGSHPRHDS